MRTFSLLLLLCAGCASQPTPTANKMPVRERLVASVDGIVRPYPTAQPPPAIVTRPLYLTWENHNAPENLPYLVTDFWSTTNLLQSFRFKFRVPQFTNSVLMPTTNRMEFFICRFLDTRTGDVSEWNVK